MKYLIPIFCLLILAIQAQNLWPEPKKLTINKQQSWTLPAQENPINYIVKSPKSKDIPPYIQEILTFYNNLIFNQKSQISFKKPNIRASEYTLNIEIENWDLTPAYTPSEETYTLNLTQKTTWTLKTPTYFGFLRALETFSQLIKKNKEQKYEIFGGITIEDSPDYMHRGLMIEPSSTFLTVEAIKKYINSMMYNKLNVLHIRFSNDYSFPLYLKDYSDLSKKSAFSESQTYPLQTIEDLVQYGLTRGVRIIPEITTPTQTQSWNKAEKLKDVSILCKKPVFGQIDPTLDQTYEALNNIFEQINSEFADNFVHFGGEATSDECYDKRSEIKKFMEKNNLKTYQDLQNFYRNKQQNIWEKDIKSKKNIIYWADEHNYQLNLKKTDIIQWKGNSTHIESIQSFENRIILSISDALDLSLGFGNIKGDESEIKFNTWRDIYEQTDFSKYSHFKGTFIGAEALLWGDLVNDQNIEIKTWVRGTTLAEKTWNQQANKGETNIVNLITRMQAQYERMTSRGIRGAPMSTQQCQTYPSLCFYNR